MAERDRLFSLASVFRKPGRSEIDVANAIWVASSEDAAVGGLTRRIMDENPGCSILSMGVALVPQELINKLADAPPPQDGASETGEGRDGMDR